MPVDTFALIKNLQKPPRTHTMSIKFAKQKLKMPHKEKGVGTEEFA